MKILTLNDYTAPEETKNVVRLSIQAAKIKNKPFPHAIITGPPGTGKTTLSFIISYEMHNNISNNPSDNSSTNKVIEIFAPSVKSIQTIINTFLKCKKGDIIFIDEIHALDEQYEEILYPIMENNILHFTVLNKPITYDIPPITVIGATTDPSKVSTSLYDRFKLKIQLQKHNNNSMKEIISNYINKIIKLENYNMKYSDESINQLIIASRNTPRNAINHVNLSMDYALVNNLINVTKIDILNTLNLIGIDETGLSKVDRKIIETIYNSGDKTSLDTLSNILGYSKKDISEIYEPYLIENEFIAISSSGRILNKNGYNYINKLNNQ